MKRTILSIVLALSWLLATPLMAADNDPAQAEAKPGEESEGWTGFLDREFERIGAMDLYGVTSQLPQGYLSFKWDWGTIRAKNRYNNQRKLGPVMEPIAFTDDGNELINIDLGLNGHGGGHTFQLSYGITDPLDWYIEVPFTYMNVSFDPKMADIKTADGEVYTDADGDTYKVHPTLLAPLLGIKDGRNFTACEFLYETMPMLGRPTPAADFQGKWMLGDINTGFSWNIYRTELFSVALTPRVYLPTGHKPHPNNNLLWGTGPEIETGIGGWAAGFTQGYDLRLFRHVFHVGKVGIPLDLIASTEFGAAYGFPQEREYPDNFPTPNPLASQMDPSAFPDLSQLDGTFTYTPGWSVDWVSQVQLQFAIFGLGVAYGIQHSQEPELIGDGSFLMMAKGLELLGQQTLEALQFAGSISLLPFYIPLDIAFQYRKVIDGYNAIVFDNYYQVTVKGYVPLKLLWE